MKYTVKEFADILQISTSAVWQWINDGIESPHSNHGTERFYLKAEKVPGRGQGGSYYVIHAVDAMIFMDKLYDVSYFKRWFGK